MTLYLDASVLVALVAKEPGATSVTAVLGVAERPLIASDFAVAETSAALARLLRIGARTAGQLEEAFTRLDGWIDAATSLRTVTSTDVAEANLLVRNPDLALRAPDAIHIAAAARLGAVLVTLDKGMTRAAAALDIPCLNPADASAL